MAEIKINPAQNIPHVEDQRDLQEILKAQDPNTLQNCALKRCTETPVSPDKTAHQAYDRMHHTHNRHK